MSPMRQGLDHGSMAFALRTFPSRRPGLFPSRPLPAASGSLASGQDTSVPRVSPRSWRPNTEVLRNHLRRCSSLMDFVVLSLSPGPKRPKEAPLGGAGSHPRRGSGIQGLRRSDAGGREAHKGPPERTVAAAVAAGDNSCWACWNFKGGGRGERGVRPYLRRSTTMAPKRASKATIWKPGDSSSTVWGSSSVAGAGSAPSAGVSKRSRVSAPVAASKPR